MTKNAIQDKLNVLYSSDDNYAQHMGVSIYSLLNHNSDFETINIYIVDNGISDLNRNKLQQLVSGFANAVLEFIPFQNWSSKLKLNMEWDISISSYARLFVGSMLPDTVEKVLYLDCDMIICDSVRELWNTELDKETLAAVQDAVSGSTKEAVGLSEDEKYFNAGLLLIDLVKWRLNNCEKQCLMFIAAKNGSVTHHDQGVLNGLFHKQVHILPLKYNIMTIHYIFNQKSILKYSKDNADFYTEKEITEAKSNPVILHYTPSFTSRPWVKGCKHPLKSYYWDTLKLTPWTGARPQSNSVKWYVRLIEWRYRTFPF